MLKISDQEFNCRLLLGTAQYPSPKVLTDAITESGTEIITVSLRRQNVSTDNAEHGNKFWQMLQQLPCQLLPNTAGCYSAKEAITTAQMARELFNTNWIKLEVIGDDYTLQPNVFELVKAADTLVKEGFEVFPYCTDDLIACQQLVDCGCNILMPWAAPIGSGRGPQNPYALELLRERFHEQTLIVDAGIGKPSHATQVMEMGYDAVLLNTAVARAADPVAMAKAFAHATQAGLLANTAGCIEPQQSATASTPLIDKPFWKVADV